MLLEGLLELLLEPPFELLLGMLLEGLLELLLGVLLELDPEWILFIGTELLLDLSELTILLAGGRFDFLEPDLECRSS